MSFKEFLKEAKYDIDEMMEIISGESGTLDVKAQAIVDEYFDDNFINSEKYAPDEDYWYYMNKYMTDSDIEDLFNKIKSIYNLYITIHNYT